MTVEVLVSNRLLVAAPPGSPLGKAARKRTTWANPDYGRARAAGRWTGSIPQKLTTFREVDPGSCFSVSRGSVAELRDAASEAGERLVFRDRRVSVPVPALPPFVVVPGNPEARLAPYQERAVLAALEREQGVIRAPTGSGKTTDALAIVHRARQRALVVVRDKNLMDQWVRCAGENLGIAPRDVGVVQGKRRRVG
ncbi:MAG: DEAD/DEAH box helicase family protein, partial [Thermoplasmata archaeon]|nr:DEAD/DEAH box helicase family protein [Thermoplasmata archaeon]